MTDSLGDSLSPFSFKNEFVKNLPEVGWQWKRGWKWGNTGDLPGHICILFTSFESPPLSFFPQWFLERTIHWGPKGSFTETFQRAALGLLDAYTLWGLYQHMTGVEVGKPQLLASDGDHSELWLTLQASTILSGLCQTAPGWTPSSSLSGFLLSVTSFPMS